MYVYGGVNIIQRNNTRVPADSEAGLLHAFNFNTYTWSTISTTGGGNSSSLQNWQAYQKW